MSGVNGGSADRGKAARARRVKTSAIWKAGWARPGRSRSS